ncbi:MAG: hypothetical protein M3P27_10625 [Acidobacteriota bacterium]|nr:hypothetical protein [Acidobacteriota bacterium]
MGKLFVIPKAPQPKQMDERSPDPRYLEGQRLLVEAMKYLAQTDPRKNRPAISLLSEHFRTRFRMSDKPPA